jgi:hypothetical protein
LLTNLVSREISGLSSIVVRTSIPDTVDGTENHSLNKGKLAHPDGSGSQGSLFHLQISALMNQQKQWFILEFNDSQAAQEERFSHESGESTKIACSADFYSSGVKAPNHIRSFKYLKVDEDREYRDSCSFSRQNKRHTRNIVASSSGSDSVKTRP